MRGRSGMTTPASNNEPKAEPKTATVAAPQKKKWWQEIVGKNLRQSERARRKYGSIVDKDAVYTGYPARYNYEGLGFGEYVARYLNSASAGTRLNVRFSPMSSFSILRADDDFRKGVERVIKLVKQLQTLQNEPVGQKRQEVVNDINTLLRFYAEREVVYADCGQAEHGTKIEIVVQREPMDFVVVDGAKLRKAVAAVLSNISVTEGNADRFGDGRQADHGRNSEVLKDFHEIVGLLDEAIERGPTAEEHRAVNYVLELAAHDLVSKLRPCDCGCGCGQWLYQIKGTHKMCAACTGRDHMKDDEERMRRNAQARDRYRYRFRSEK